jgi:hypothetical protein
MQEFIMTTMIFIIGLVTGMYWHYCLEKDKKK